MFEQRIRTEAEDMKLESFGIEVCLDSRVLHRWSESSLGADELI